MDIAQKTESEQLDFYEKSYERFLKAKASAGEISHFYKVSGTTVRLLFAGNKLVPFLTPALAHLRIQQCEPPDVTFCIWDSDSTETEMLPPPCEWANFTDRGDIWGFNSRRVKTAFHWIECSVNLMDLETNTGIYWVQTADTLPYWVKASPLRTLFHWWMEKNGCQLLHAAAVGTEQGSVLITGKGGVGKSTTALSCLQSGLYYVADDYVITCLEPEPLVYSLYSTAKLDADHVHHFPELAKFIKNPQKLDQEKAVMFLFPPMREQILPEMPLKAILASRVMNQDETALSPVQRSTIHRAMSFTTMSQLPYVGRHTHDFIGRLSSLLPGYALDLGRDLHKIPAAVSNFIDDMPRYQAIHRLELDSAKNLDTKPLVSVIIPVFNGEDFIRDAIENVMSQNYPALEIIIVDDGSTDRTGEIINKLPTDIRYFKQPNGGPASARNRGIKDVSADFLVFLDVDDLWPENNLCLLVDEMLKDPNAEVIRGYAQIMEYDEATGEYDFVGNPMEAFPDYIGAAIYRKSVFHKVGLFDATLIYGEDTDWFNRAHELNIKVKRLEDTTLLVRRHGQNMTCGKDNVELGRLRVLKKFLDRKRAGERALMNTRLQMDT